MPTTRVHVDLESALDHDEVVQSLGDPIDTFPEQSGLKPLASTLRSGDGLLRLDNCDTALNACSRLACWSYRRLSEPERILLGRLAGLSGTWTLAQAEAMCGDAALRPAHIADVLEALVNRSLVQVEHHDVVTHYRLLGTVQQYVWELGEPRGRADTCGSPGPSRLARLNRLIPREWDVLDLLAQGCSNRDIGVGLVITEATARIHVEHILSKLHVHSRTQAALWALNHGIGPRATHQVALDGLPNSG